MTCNSYISTAFRDKPSNEAMTLFANSQAHQKRIGGQNYWMTVNSLIFIDMGLIIFMQPK